MPTSSFAQASATTSSPSDDNEGDATNNVPIIIGVVVGVIFALIAIGLAVYYFRNREALLRRYGRLIGVPPSDDDEEKARGSQNVAVFDVVTPASGDSSSSRKTVSSDDRQIRVKPHSMSVPSIRNSMKRIPIFARHKPLPDLPPPPSPTLPPTNIEEDIPPPKKTSSFRPTRPFRRTQPPVVPVDVEPQSIRRTGAVSTISSFFPTPMDPRDGALMSKSVGSVSRKSSMRSSIKAISPINEQGRRELEASYPIPSPGVWTRPTSSSLVQSVRPLMIQPPPRGASRPLSVSNPDPPSDDVNVTAKTVESPDSAVAEPSTLTRTRTSQAVQNLDVIPESFPSTPGSRSSIVSKSSKSSRGSKRRSLGRRRLDKEKSRKSLGRTINSPRGPRFRTPSTSAHTSLVLPTPSTLPQQATTPPTPNTAGTAHRRPLPPSPMGPRRPSLSRGPHVLVPLHLITRLQSPPAVRRASMLNTRILQWQQQQLAQSQQSLSPQRSATEGTFSSSLNSSILSSLPSSLVALFPNPPQQGSSDQSLPSTFNTASGQAAMQLLTPRPTVRRPSRAGSKAGSPESEKAANSAVLGVEASPAAENVQSQPRADTSQPKARVQVPTGPVITNAPLVTSPVPSTPKSRPLPAPSVPINSPTVISPSVASVTSPLSPRRPLPAPLTNLPSSSLTSGPPIPPPPYSGRRIPGASGTSGNEIQKLTALYHKLPPSKRDVPHTPSMNSWSSLKLSTSIQEKLGSDHSPLDPTSAEVLMGMLDERRESGVPQQAVDTSTPPTPLPMSLPPQPTLAPSLSVQTNQLPHAVPRHLAVSKSKSRPPALSIISGSAASSLQETPPPVSRAASDENVLRVDLPEVRPLSTPKRISGVSTINAQVPPTPPLPLFPPPPPPELVLPSESVAPIQGPPRKIGLPARPSPGYLEASRAHLPRQSAGSISSSAQITPPSSRGNSDEIDRLSIDLPEIRPLYTPRRTSVASTSSNRLPALPSTPPPPLPVNSAPTPAPLRIRTKVWTQEGTSARGRAAPFPVSSRNRPANEVNTTFLSEQSNP